MATVTAQQFRARQFGSTPYGNKTVLPFKLKTNAVGAAIDSSQATGLAIADVVVLGTLPAGMLITDSTVIVSTAMTALVTGSLGIAYVDGVDSTLLPQSASLFGTGLVLNAAGRLRNATTNELIKLPKDAYLILTTAGAANAKASTVDFVIEGEL
ncbi:hypothetical protein [Rhodoferax ferrireducens]|uniref:hypothetical protein n=1 Tax=Rhodoferax ferrireducens TaxID=192843 RepID=UPI000E0CCF56|nr:hypothetical protein [Rhodoferax ferrireducens]